MFINLDVVYSHGGAKHGEVKTQKISTPARKLKLKQINVTYLAKVKPIFKRSCFDCHSDQTAFPWYYKLPIIGWIIDEDIKEAREHMDFSKDYPFISHESPVEDLKELMEVIEEDEMPLFSYKIMHPSSALSDKEKEDILNWAKESLKILSGSNHDNL